MEYSRRLAQMIQVQKITIDFFKKKNADVDADVDANYADTNTIYRHIYPSNLFYPPD
jgi:hypothetical protein